MHSSLFNIQINSNQRTDSPAVQEHRRIANFLSLANLESQVPSQLFHELKVQMNDAEYMPHRLAWDCSSHSCSFDEFRLISGLSGSPFLSNLVSNQDSLASKIQKFMAGKNDKQADSNPVATAAASSLSASLPNFLRQASFSKNTKIEDLANLNQRKRHHLAVTQALSSQSNDLYHRMKTVFGHAIIADGSGTPIYNCKFDNSGDFIITGADDGIIKVWDKHTMVLQASLHGHQDVINDIAISQCNRFMASGSKDGTLIIWDLKTCSIIKRITEDNNSQINNLRFFMIECSQRQASKNLQSLQQQSRQALSCQETATQSQGLSSIEDHQPKVFDQFLLSCSDDGCIMIYDCSSFTAAGSEEFYLQSDINNLYTPMTRGKQAVDQHDVQLVIKMRQLLAEQQIKENQSDKIVRNTRKRKQGTLTNQTTANSSSQSQPLSQIDIFRVKLRSDDFRAGTRNKHIDSFSVSPKGFVAGGTNHGEVYLWKVNFAAIRSRKVDGHYSWVNSFKVHKKSIHNIQFNPAGDILLCGSADGTAQIFDTRFEKAAGVDQFYSEVDHEQPQPLDLRDITIGDGELIHRFEQKSSKHQLVCAIDWVNWSAKGRYAACAVNIKKQAKSSQENKENSQAVIKIKIFDTVSGQVIEDLNKVCKLGKQMHGFVCTMKSHPINDNILMICYDGGVNILYDLEQLAVLQEIVEYGIYSIDQFTMNNQMDVDFSPDGDWLAFSSVFGTLSLYTTQCQRKAQYQCTRVQQFFWYDNQNHDTNIFETLEKQPQLCGYELNPYEVQPTPPKIGKFKQLTPSLTPSDFYKQQLFAREFAVEEENFYINQLKDGMRQGYFENNGSHVRAASDNNLAVSPSRQPNVHQMLDADMYYESDMELIGGTRAVRSRRAARIANSRRTLIRNDDLPEDIDDSEDEEFKDEESSSSSNHDQTSDIDFISIQSENVGQLRASGGQRRAQGRVQTQRLNYHVVNDRSQSDQESPSEVIPTRNRLQTRRANQRQNILDSQSTNQSGRQQTRARPQRLRQVVHSGETSQFDERMDDQSDFNDRHGYRNRGSRTRRPVNNERMELLSSDDESAGEFSSGESERPKIRKNRRSGLRVSSRPNYDEEEDEEEDFVKTRHHRQAPVDDDQSMEMPTSKMDLFSEADLKLEQIITEPTNQIPRDDAFSVRASKSKDGVKVAKQQRFPAFPKIRDFEYKIDSKIKPQGRQMCAFCRRSIEQSQLTGPFVRDTTRMETKCDSQEAESVLYFHQECLEVNQFVRYNEEQSQWSNIGFAIRNLVLKKQYQCYRCFGNGATVQCMSCQRAFHGHNCSSLYLLSNIEEHSSFMCIFCRANQNHLELKQEAIKFAKENIVAIRKAIPRDHLLSSAQFSPDKEYLPQIGDQVMYFWQGHEQFKQSFNCFSYHGGQKVIGSADLPWLANPELKTPTGMVECEVLSICHKFAHCQTEYLISLFGQTSFPGVNQTSQIVSYVELKVVDQSLPSDIRFLVALFPNEVAHFIVPTFLFGFKQHHFMMAMSLNKFVGRRFKSSQSSKEFQVIEVNPLEPEHAPGSLWQTVVVKEVSSQVFKPVRGRASPSQLNFEDTSRINFWDLVYPEESVLEIPTAFEKFETSRMLDSLTLFFNRKLDLCQEFLERVEPSLAADYKGFVPAEMWLQLIFNRIQNFYYRSQDQLWSELDLITHCSFVYNGKEDELTIKAQGVVEKIRKELKTHINSNNEKLIQSKKGKKFQISNVSSNQFGFADPMLNPESTSVRKNSPVDVGHRVKLVDLFDGTSLIEIDLKQGKVVEEQTIKRLRGRPRKSPLPNQNFMISIDPNEEEDVQPILNRRKRREIVLDEDTSMLGKRTFNQAMNSDVVSDGLHSNQENKRFNN